MSLELWNRYKQYLCVTESVGLRLDISRMRFADDYFERMAAPLSRAFTAMDALEQGALANPDEKRMVGHYWLRTPELAPTPELRAEIESTLQEVQSFAARVHSGAVAPERAARFVHLLVIGIGGSALGPQLVADALGGADDKLTISFFDNTDPDGFDRVLARLGDGLSQTLTIVISKSGGTKETRNGMLEAQRAYAERGLRFAKHAVAITGAGSELDQFALREGFLARFPMWDWVGGRTSELSAVGLLPAALQGIDVRALLDGARAMDEATRKHVPRENPAALLALMWHYAGAGQGKKDLVVLPYKDRLLLLSRYLQQLIMESLGKERDLDGKVVHQGLSVYGNKGSTDQHAYVQQLRDGLPNFFATFLHVQQSRNGASPLVEPETTSGDYLHGFYLGTRAALYENGRESITITTADASARTLGALIALFERAVGLYATLIHVNAYHQPGVEAGKKAAAEVLSLQHALVAQLRQDRGNPRTADELAAAAGLPEQAETAFHVLEHLSADPARGIKRQPGARPYDARYFV